MAGTLRARAQTTETHSFTNLNRAIPDGDASGLSDVRTVTSAIAQLSSVRVKLHIAGEYNGDLYAYLRHVQGSITNFCVLLNRPGRSLANLAGYDDSGLEVVFQDAAALGDIHTYRAVTNLPSGTPLTGPWQPDGRAVDPDESLDSTPRTTPLSSFNGRDASGQWTLYLADGDAGGTNLLVSWELEFTGSSAATGTGLVELEAFVGTSRLVTFKATDAAGTVLKTCDRTLDFGGNSIASYTLTDVPPQTARLSAKTAWNLRKRLDVLFSGGQAVVRFTGNNLLQGGDLDDSNSAEMDDYLILAAYVYTDDSTADIDGNGGVDLDDYFIVAGNIYGPHGDPP
jgi:subtilisin-like proprotein convertase family protein